MANEMINRKLLEECIKAASEGKMDKAKRLFARNWHESYVSNYKLMEAEAGSDEELISDEFADEITSDFETESSNKYEEAQFAVDELEDKVDEYFEGDEAEDVKQKLDDVRNDLSELSAATDIVAEGEDCEDCEIAEKEDEARVVIEDIKADFENKLGELPEDVADVFGELEETFGEAESDEEAGEEVADAEAEEPVEECGKAVKEDVEGMDLEAPVEEPAEAPAEEKSDDEKFDDEELKDLILDINDNAEALQDKFDEITGEKEPVAEEWSKLKVERNGNKNEEEGVKKSSMDFAKVSKINTKPKLNVSHENSAGNSANVKMKNGLGRENKGLSQYEKVKVDNKA
jgi:hypothetical protein